MSRPARNGICRTRRGMSFSRRRAGQVRPTLRMNGAVPVNDEATLEHEADVMGARAVETTMARAARTGQIR